MLYSHVQSNTQVAVHLIIWRSLEKVIKPVLKILSEIGPSWYTIPKSKDETK